MAKYVMDKKELRQDIIREWMLKLVAWANLRRKWLMAGSILLVAAVVLIFAYGWYQGRALEEQAEKFYAAEKIINDTTMPEKERKTAAVGALTEFIEAYPDAALSPYAWMYLAQIYWSDENLKEATRAFRMVVEHGRATPFTLHLALIGQAKMDEADKAFKQSAERYKSLPDKPYSDLKAYNLGRLAAAGRRPKEAREHFKKVISHFPPSQLAQWATDAMSALP